MSGLRGAIAEIYSLEQLADREGWLQQRQAGVKLLTTACFVLCVISFDRYALSRLAPYFFYTFVLTALSDVPWGPLLRRLALALPFVLLAGLSNLLLDRQIALYLGRVAVSAGAVSCLSILLRTMLCVHALLLLAATTPFWQLSAQLRAWRCPPILATVLEMTYRYLGALLDQAWSMTLAYRLRHGGGAVEMRHMGLLLGQLLLRSFDRAERIYGAMKCRGFGADPDSSWGGNKASAWQTADWLYLLSICLPCLLLRAVDVNALFTRLGGLL